MECIVEGAPSITDSTPDRTPQYPKNLMRNQLTKRATHCSVVTRCAVASEVLRFMDHWSAGASVLARRSVTAGRLVGSNTQQREDQEEEEERRGKKIWREIGLAGEGRVEGGRKKETEEEEGGGG